ncbi:MAG: outer membrane protein [Halieaceae bacterium]|jgi:outer membrane protein
MRSVVTLLALFLAAPLLAAPLRLIEVYARAVEEDPRVNIAELQVEAGEAQKDAAGAAMLPQASVNAQWSDNRVTFDRLINPREVFDGERYGLQVRQMLFNWSQISARGRANRILNQRQSELIDTMGQLSVDVAERYFNVLLADDGVRLLKDEKNLVEKQLAETQARYERKLVPLTDLLETQSRVDQVRTDLIEAENDAALARVEISALTGAPVVALVPVRSNPKLPEIHEPLEYWIAAAREKNAALLARKDAVAAARKSVEQTRGEYMPNLSFVASAQRSDVGFDNLQSPQRDVVYLGVEVSMPLFAGGGNMARMRESWSQYYVAREEEEGTLREVEKRVRSSWLNARSSRARVDAAGLSVQSAKTAFDAMSKAFSLGGARSADVLEALHRRTRTERDYQQAIYGYLFHWLSLQRETGEIDVDDLWLLDNEIIEAASPVGAG